MSHRTATPRRREIPLERPKRPRAWEAAAYAVLAGTLVLIGLLLWRPVPTLRWTWNVIVPLLPASFLVTPALWRNLCPLATLNELPQRFVRNGRLPAAWWASGAVAVLALVLLVPARRAVLNVSGVATALAVAGLGAIALALGAIYAARSGFCNSACPVLPVERLYGQKPMVELRGSRCAACTFCTPRGCMDLARDKAMAQVLGSARHGPRWLLTPMGAFGALFPGLILAYFTTPDIEGTITAGPWLRALAFGGMSYLAVTLVALATGTRGSRGLAWLAAVSFGLYYWFAAAGLSAELGLGATGRAAIRFAAAVLLAVWAWRARERLGFARSGAA